MGTITNSQSSLKFMSIESVMPSSHLILCRPLLLRSIFPNIRVRCAGRHEPVAAYADFFIRVSEQPAPTPCCGEPRAR